MFIIALSFAYFSKALTGTYMKSSITQIERRFDLSSTRVGLIDGSFEMGTALPAQPSSPSVRLQNTSLSTLLSFSIPFCLSLTSGNLLFLAVVSHFGAQLHRPRLIAAGCLLMAVGALLTGLTHFFMGL